MDIVFVFNSRNVVYVHANIRWKQNAFERMKLTLRTQAFQEVVVVPGVVGLQYGRSSQRTQHTNAGIHWSHLRREVGAGGGKQTNTDWNDAGQSVSARKS